MLGKAPPAEHAAPPVPCRVATAAASVLGSGGSPAVRAKTGCVATPAAHGSGLMAASPADRSWLVVVVPQAGVTWPGSSGPSAPPALRAPELKPATQAPPPPAPLCPSG